MQHRFLAIHRCLFGLVDRRRLVGLGFLVVQLGLMSLDRLAGLDCRLVLVVRQVLGLRSVLSGLGCLCCECHLGLVDLVGLERLVVHLHRQGLAVLAVLVVLGRRLVLGLLAVRLGLVVQLVHPVLAVLVVQLGMIGKR